MNGAGEPPQTWREFARWLRDEATSAERWRLAIVLGTLLACVTVVAAAVAFDVWLAAH